MGRIRFSFLVVLVVLIAFSCSMPRGVQVKGTLEMKFPAVSTFDDLFTRQMEKSFASDHSQFTVKVCGKPTTLTYVMYLPIIDEAQDARIKEELEALFALSDTDVITIPGPDHNILLEDRAKEIRLAKLPDFLRGFEFEHVAVKIYSSGNEVVDSFLIDINIVDSQTGKHVPVTIDGRNREHKEESIGFNTAWLECPWPKLPDEGVEEKNITELTNSNDEIHLEYKVYLKVGEEFRREWIEDTTLRIEMVLWLPLILGPKNHEEGADIIFSDVFGKGEDAFGRANEDDTLLTDAMDWINFVLKLNRNPFENGMMHIEDKNVSDIPSKRIKGKLVKMAIPKENMKEVKITIPFAPDLRIHFDYDDNDPEKNAMHIPRDFRTSTIYLEAGINLKQDL